MWQTPPADVLRAALIAFINLFVPGLVIMNVADVSTEQLAWIISTTTALTSLVFLFYKGGSVESPH